jgi:hypothetical protein
LIFVLSVFSYLGHYPLRAADGAHGPFCAQAVVQWSSDAQLSAESPSHGGAAQSAHCADCPMAAQIIEPPRVDFGVGERIVTRLVVNLPRPMEPRERRRSGEAQSRAPPSFS